MAATTGETAATTAATDASSAGTDTTEVADETTGSAGGETPAPAGVSDAEWEEIVTAAQDEGKVTIYSSQGLDQLNDLAERFNDEYGIELEVVRDIDSALIPKVEAEQTTGSGIADVIAQASAAWSEQRGAEGWFVAPVGPAFDDPAYDRAANVSDLGFFTSSAAVLTFGWNTDQYPAGLTDYSDLLDPELAGGRIGVIEPSAPSIVDFWLYLEENYGEDFVTQLAAQEPKIYPSSLPMAQALTSGEISAASFVQVLGRREGSGRAGRLRAGRRGVGRPVQHVDPEHRPAPQRRPGAVQLPRHRARPGSDRPQGRIGAARHRRCRRPPSTRSGSRTWTS